MERLRKSHAGSSPRALALQRHRADVVRLVGDAGGSNVRVFGSVATGSDHDDSDIDLLINLPDTVGLLELARLERRISMLLGYEVDLVPESDLIGPIKQRVLGDALPL